MHPITTVHYLALSTALLLIGTVGVLTRRNIVIILMSIELILNAVNINLIAFSHALQNVNVIEAAVGYAHPYRLAHFSRLVTIFSVSHKIEKRAPLSPSGRSSVRSDRDLPADFDDRFDRQFEIFG